MFTTQSAGEPQQALPRGCWQPLLPRAPLVLARAETCRRVWPACPVTSSTATCTSSWTGSSICKPTFPGAPGEQSLFSGPSPQWPYFVCSVRSCKLYVLFPGDSAIMCTHSPSEHFVETHYCHQSKLCDTEEQLNVRS